MTDNRCNKDSALIKIIAVIFMLIDHIGASIYPGVTELRILGRIAFPLFAWGVALGADYTRNIWIYAARVLLLGIAVQPLYNLVLHHTWQQLNIMFTISLGLLGIAGIRLNKYGSAVLLPFIAILLTRYLSVDYGFRGVLFIILLYMSRRHRSSVIAYMMAYALYWGSGSFIVKNIFGLELDTSNPILSVFSPFLALQSLSILALPLMIIPTNSGIKIPKWLSYALYPLHLILLLLLQNILK